MKKNVKGKRGANTAKSTAKNTAKSTATSLDLAPILLALVVLLSMITWLPAKSQFEAVDVSAAMAGLVALVASAIIVLRRPSRSFGRLGIAWTAFLGVAALSALVSGRGWTAFMGEPTNMLGFGVLAALTLTVVAAALLAPQLRELLVRYGWLVLAIETFIAFGQMSLGYQGSGTAPNSTYFGCLVLLLLPWVITGAEDAWSAREQRARAVVALVAVVALAASGARAALAVAVVWGVWVIARRSSLSRRLRVLVIVGMIAAVAAVAIAFAGSALTAALGDRPAMYTMAVRAVAQRPILGWGPDGFFAGGASASTEALARSMRLLMLEPGTLDPHNLLLWVAVSTGIVGLAAFLWFAVEVVLALLARRGDATVAPGVWGVAGTVLVFLTAPASLLVLPLFAVVLGVTLAAPVAVAKGAQAPERSWATAGLGVLGAVALLLTLSALTRVPFENANEQRSPSLAPTAQRVADFAAFDPHLSYEASLHWIFTNRPEAQNDALRDSARAAKLDTRSPLYADQAARVLSYYSAPPQQLDPAFAEVYRRYPIHPIARAAYAFVLAKQGRVVEAKRQLAIAELAYDLGDTERQALQKAAAEEIQKAEAAQRAK